MDERLISILIEHQMMELDRWLSYDLRVVEIERNKQCETSVFAHNIPTFTRRKEISRKQFLNGFVVALFSPHTILTEKLAF